jgi:hypothetical protein
MRSRAVDEAPGQIGWVHAAPGLPHSPVRPQEASPVMTRNPLRVPIRPPDSLSDTAALFRALFRDEPPKTVNVLEFDGCELESCDCGATIRLGLQADTLPQLLLGLQGAGLTVRSVPPLDASVLPADWRTRLPFSLWAGAIQLREEATTKSDTAKRAMLDYLRRHGLPVTEGV